MAGICAAAAAFVSGTPSPAHLNPAVTFAMALKRWTPSGLLFHISAHSQERWWLQILLSCTKPHYEAEENAAISQQPSVLDQQSRTQCIQLKLAKLGTLWFLLLTILPGALTFKQWLGTLQWEMVFTRWDNGGYALNPARDLGPSHHAMHRFPQMGKMGTLVCLDSSCRAYSWAVLVFSLF